jgi:hypothetical protein
MAERAAVASGLVPELVVVTLGTKERLLPEAADGEVEVWAGNDGFEAYGYAAGGRYWAHFPGIASFRFDAGRSNVIAIPEPDMPPQIVEDAYFRNVLPLVIQLRGHEVLHASAVDTRDGLAVLCGASGTGKSTFAYGLSRRGYPAWADDAVALDIGESGVTALSVPFRLGLRPDASSVFGRDARIVKTEIAARSPLAALVMLEPSDLPRARVVRIALREPSAAVAALLPHAYYFQLSDTARKALMLDRYLQVASSVQTFSLRYRRGLDHLTVVLDAIEQQLLAH